MIESASPRSPRWNFLQFLLRDSFSNLKILLHPWPSGCLVVRFAGWVLDLCVADDPGLHPGNHIRALCDRVRQPRWVLRRVPASALCSSLAFLWYFHHHRPLYAVIWRFKLRTLTVSLFAWLGVPFWWFDVTIFWYFLVPIGCAGIDFWLGLN